MLSQNLFIRLQRCFAQLEHALGVSESQFVSNIHQKLSSQQAFLVDNNLISSRNIRKKFQQDQQLQRQPGQTQLSHNSSRFDHFNLYSHQNEHFSSDHHDEASSSVIPQHCSSSLANISTISFAFSDSDICDPLQNFTHDDIIFHRPRDCYLGHILTHLISQEITSTRNTRNNSSDTALTQSIQNLLITVELIQSGLECRTKARPEVERFEHKTNFGRKGNVKRPSSMLRGNFYLYSVPFYLIRLQHGAINDLLSSALQERISAQYWIEREEKQNFCTGSSVECLTERSQHLISAWNLVLHTRDTLLPDSTGRAISHLFGRDNNKALKQAGQLGCNLAKIFALLDDLSYFTDTNKAMPTLEKLNESSYLKFFLRLPVVLFLSQNGGEFLVKSDIQSVIKQIDDMIRTGKSDCIAKTGALIEAYANNVNEQIFTQFSTVWNTNNRPKNPTNDVMFEFLNVCSKIQDYVQN